MTSSNYATAYTEGFERTVRFLISRGARSEAAHEAAQAAWVRGWEQIHQLRDESLVTTWVNTIALNVHRRIVRKESRVKALPELSTAFSVDFAAIDLTKILNGCRPYDRALLRRQMQGLTAREIAKD